MTIPRILDFAARVISGRRRFDHVSDMRDALGWLDSSQHFHNMSLSLLHKVIRTGEPECIAGQIHTYRDSRAHVRSTRQDHLLQLPAIHSEAGRRRFLHRAPSLFNEIPTGIQDLKGAQFRKHLKSYLRDLS